MDMLDDFNPLEWDGSTLILYGIGHDCKQIECGLKKSGIDHFVYCDKKASLFGDSFQGKGMIHPIELKNHKDDPVIICTGKYFREAKETIEHMGCKKIYTGVRLSRLGMMDFAPNGQKDHPYAYRQAVYGYAAIMSNYWTINHLDVFITECCTLNSFGCANLIPYYQKPKHHSLDSVEAGIARLLSTKCYIADLCLIGGEPLLNESVLCHVVSTYNAEDSIGIISMITNGTIVPSDETLSIMAKSDKLCVLVSDYGEVSTRLNQLKEKLAIWNIPSISLEENKYPWWSEGELCKYDRTEEETQDMFSSCEEKDFCTTLMNGKLFICERIANGENLGIIPISDKNSVHLTDMKFMNLSTEERGRHCREFLGMETYPPGCEYCAFDKTHVIPRAKQMCRKNHVMGRCDCNDKEL